VEVLDAALGSVVEKALELRGLEVRGVDDQGEALEAAARARLARQGVQLSPRVVAGAEVHLEGGAVRPPALPQVAPPASERPRADGVLEGEVRQDVQPQLFRERRDAVCPDRIRFHRLTSVIQLNQPLLLRSAAAAAAAATAAGVDRHFLLVPNLGRPFFSLTHPETDAPPLGVVNLRACGL